ncbi:peroxiredoxin [Congregibacter sp.]|uniref:peroxiredoxin n=1 Tax=Congregibacter sp. TaxID=2744308 RepID=UPI003F6C2BFF
MSNALSLSLRSLFVFVLGLSAVAVQAELKVGDRAPNFTLQASDGETYDLADYRGKQAVVLAWFPRAFTSGCTVECKSLAENGDEIRKFDVTYFMASTDPVEKNAEFADETKADFPLLSDPDGEVARAYGVFTRGFARRYTFYIDVDGVITHIDTAVKPSSSAEDMIANLENLGVAQRDS